MSPAATIVASPPGGGGGTTTTDVDGPGDAVVVGSSGRGRGFSVRLLSVQDESSARSRAPTAPVTPSVLDGRVVPRRALTSRLRKPATLPRASRNPVAPGASHLRIGRQRSWPAPEARSEPLSAHTWDRNPISPSSATGATASARSHS